ncbi:MAG: PKD domain-containing protein, partial [Oscillospiraceae bacterium]|nr:PKD domain-containing protein [Oscillospiraceae bacterium]
MTAATAAERPTVVLTGDVYMTFDRQWREYLYPAKFTVAADIDETLSAEGYRAYYTFRSEGRAAPDESALVPGDWTLYTDPFDVTERGAVFAVAARAGEDGSLTAYPETLSSLWVMMSYLDAPMLWSPDAIWDAALQQNVYRVAPGSFIGIDAWLPDGGGAGEVWYTWAVNGAVPAEPAPDAVGAVRADDAMVQIPYEAFAAGVQESVASIAVKAKAFVTLDAGGGASSETAACTFAVMTAAPVFALEDGAVTMTAAGGGDIHYTLDGGDPQNDSEDVYRYTAPHPVDDRLSYCFTARAYAGGSYGAAGTYAVLASDASGYPLPPLAKTYFVAGKQGGHYLSQRFRLTMDSPARLRFDAYLYNSDWTLTRVGAESGADTWQPSYSYADGGYVHETPVLTPGEYLLTAASGHTQYSYENDPAYDSGYVFYELLSADRLTFKIGASASEAAKPVAFGAWAADTYVSIEGGLDGDAIDYTTDGSDPRTSATAKQYVADSSVSRPKIGRNSGIYALHVKAALRRADGSYGEVYENKFIVNYRTGDKVYGGLAGAYQGGLRTAGSIDDGANLLIYNPDYDILDLENDIDFLHIYYTVGASASLPLPCTGFDTPAAAAYAYDWRDPPTLAEAAAQAGVTPGPNSAFYIRAEIFLRTKDGAGVGSYTASGGEGSRVNIQPARPTVRLADGEDGAKIMSITPAYETSVVTYSLSRDYSYAANQIPYTEPVTVDRNAILRVRGTWPDGTGGAWSEPQRIWLGGAHDFAVPALDAGAYYPSASTYVDVPVNGDNPQSFTVNVPAGRRYRFTHIAYDSAQSQSGASVGLEKWDGGRWAVQDAKWIDVLTANQGIAPALTAGLWRFTVTSEGGGLSDVSFRLYNAENEGDYTYPPLTGLAATPTDSDIRIGLIGLTLTDAAVSEIQNTLRIYKESHASAAWAVPTAAEIRTALAWGSDKIYRYYLYRQVQGNANYSSVYSGVPAEGVYADSSVPTGASCRYYAVVDLNFYSDTNAFGWLAQIDGKDWLRTAPGGAYVSMLTDEDGPTLTEIAAVTPAGAPADSLNHAVKFSVDASDNQYLAGAVWEYKKAADPDSAYQSFKTDNWNAYNDKTHTFTASLPPGSALTAGESYAVRVRVTDKSGNESVKLLPLTASADPTVENIRAAPGSSSLTAAWDSLGAGWTYTVRFLKNNSPVYFSYEYNTSGGTSNVLGASGLAAAGLTAWFDPDKPEHQGLTVSVAAYAASSGYTTVASVSAETYAPSTDTEAPAVSIAADIAGADGASVYGGKSVTVKLRDDSYADKAALSIVALSGDGQESAVPGAEVTLYAQTQSYVHQEISLYHTYDTTILTDGVTYRMKAVGYDRAGHAAAPVYGSAFTTINGTTSHYTYPKLTGLSAAPTERGFIFNPGQLAYADKAKEELYRYLKNDRNFTSLTMEELEAYLTGGVSAYRIYSYLGSSSGYANAVEVPADSLDETGCVEVPISFSEANPRMAGYTSYGSLVLPGNRYSFDVQIIYPDPGTGSSDWKYYLYYATYTADWRRTARTATASILDDTAAPYISPILGPTEGETRFFNALTPFSVQVGDNQLVADVAWSYSTDGSVWVDRSASDWIRVWDDATYFSRAESYLTDVPYSLFYGAALTSGATYYVKAVVTDWTGHMSETSGAFVFGDMEAPSGLTVVPASSSIGVGWTPVANPGGAPYRYRVYCYVKDRYDTENNWYTFYDTEAGVTAYRFYPTFYETGDFRFRVAALSADGAVGPLSGFSAYAKAGADTEAPAVQFTGVWDERRSYRGTVSLTGSALDDGALQDWKIQTYTAPESGEPTLVYDGAVTSFSANRHSTVNINAQFDTTQLADGAYSLRIAVADTAGHRTLSAPRLIQIYNAAPEVADLTPTGHFALGGYGGTNVTFTWPDVSGADGVDHLVLWYAAPKTAKEASALVAAGDTPAGVFFSQNLTKTATAYTYPYSLVKGQAAVVAVAAANELGSVSAPKFACVTAEADVYSIQYYVDEIPGGDVLQGSTISVRGTASVGTAANTPVYLMHRGESGYLRNGYTDVNGHFSLSYTIPSNNFKWTGPQVLYVLLGAGSEDSGYASANLTLPLPRLTDETAPVITGVMPQTNAAIGRPEDSAQLLKITASDNSGAVAGYRVQWTEYGGAKQRWTELEVADDPQGAVIDVSAIYTSQENVFLRVMAYDGDGNISLPYELTYAIGLRGVPAPSNIMTAGGEHSVTVGWNRVTRVDTEAYSVYRQEQRPGGAVAGEEEANDGWVQIAARTSDNIYTDRGDGGAGLDPTRLYRYRVVTISRAGDVSEPSPASAWTLPGAQRGAATVLYLDPFRGASFNGMLPLTAYVADRIGLTQVVFEYAYLGVSVLAEPADVPEENWQPLATVGREDIEETEVDGALLPPGCKAFAAHAVLTVAPVEITEYFAVRVRAFNYSSDEAVYLSQYTLDNDPPSPVSGVTATDEMSGGAVVVTFHASGSRDVYRYDIYRGATNLPSEAVKVGETASTAYRDTAADSVPRYYWVAAADRAGNLSPLTGGASAFATAVSDTAVRSVDVREPYITAGDSVGVEVKVYNAGPAKAGGAVTLYMSRDGGADEETASQTLTRAAGSLLAAGQTRTLTFNAPISLSENAVNIKFAAAFVNDDDVGAEASADNNYRDGDVFTLNHRPVPAFTLADAYLSGEQILFDPSQTSDPDGDAFTLVWYFGDGASRSAQTPVDHRYMKPGVYTVRLKATDAKGAWAETSQTVTVTDNRPDIYVKEISVYKQSDGDEDWVLADRYEDADGAWGQSLSGAQTAEVSEGDAVRVSALIANKGLGDVPAALSFYNTFRLNGGTRQETRMTEGGLPVGEAYAKSLDFVYTAPKGAQVIQIRARDIVNTIGETDDYVNANNNRQVVLNAAQTQFPDIAVTGVSWVNAQTLDQSVTAFSTQDKVWYRAVLGNAGEAAASFLLTLYVDGEAVASKTVARAPGASGMETFEVTPTAGAHAVVIAADDPQLVELVTDNNRAALMTPLFAVTEPVLTVSPLVVSPAGTELAQGSTLRFDVQVGSDSRIVTPFKVCFYVDGKLLKTVSMAKNANGVVLSGGGEKKPVFAEWKVADGVHDIMVTADPECAVVSEPVTVRTVTQNVSVVKPDLWFSDVYWAPADTVDWGRAVSLAAYVSNRSTATLYTKYAIGVYCAEITTDIDGRDVVGAFVKDRVYQYGGLQGNSTSLQMLEWTPAKSGRFVLRLTLESLPGSDFDTTCYTAPWEQTLTIKDGIVFAVNPNKNGENNEFGANMFLSSTPYIDVTAGIALASRQTVKLTAGQGAQVVASILDAERTYVTAPLSDMGNNGNFAVQLLTAGLNTGNYVLRYEASAGGYHETYETNITFIGTVSGHVETPRADYAAGDQVVVSGWVTEDGQPFAGRTIVLEMDLEPSYRRQPDGTVVIREEGSEGGEIYDWWRGQKIVFLTSDANGQFSYAFRPEAKQAGRWNVSAYAYERVQGTHIAGGSFEVYGLEARPSKVNLTASKGTDFQAAVTVVNGAFDGAFGGLTGLSAVLVNPHQYPGVVVSLDQSSVPEVLPPGQGAGYPGSVGAFDLIFNVSARLDAPDEASYTVELSSVEGARATATLNLYLRPGIALPVAVPSTVTAAANPGQSVVKTVTVKNRGVAPMQGIYLRQSSLSFVHAQNLSKTSLQPGESLTYDIVFAPTADTALGKYQDSVALTNGVFTATVPVGLEVSDLTYGAAGLQITDDFGNPVPGARVDVYGQKAYVQYVDGRETVYYQNFTATADAAGYAEFADKPVGPYDFTVTANGKKKVTGALDIMPSETVALTEVVMETLPVEITWTVTETTIVDEYEIAIHIDMGVVIPTPKLGATVPWFTIAKNVDRPVMLSVNIVNNSLIDVEDVTAGLYAARGKNYSGISVAGGNYIGNIPAMGYKTVQLLVMPGYYELAAKPEAELYLMVEGSYVSFDRETGLPEYPVKTTGVRIPIYNPGASRVNVDTTTADNEGGGAVTLEMPEGLEVEEIAYILFPDETGVRIPEEKPDGGQVYETVKMELKQTASLERQAFDAELTITNNYPSQTLSNVSVQVIVERADENGVRIDATDKMYIIPIGSMASSVRPGQTVTMSWKLVPGDGMGGERPEGVVYTARAAIVYDVGGEIIETSTQAEPITILPQPNLTLSYYLPKTVYPNKTFRLGVEAVNNGAGAAKNLTLDLSQLEITENQSGLKGTWSVVGASFGSFTPGSFRLNLGDIPGTGDVDDEGRPAQNMVWGYYTIRWELPTLNLGDFAQDEVYGEIRNFSATLTHRPYAGVTLNPLITDVFTYVVGQEDVPALSDDAGGGMSMIMGANGLPAFAKNLTTNVTVQVYTPCGLAGAYDPAAAAMHFFAPAENGAAATVPHDSQTAAEQGMRFGIYMLTEADAQIGAPIAQVIRYDTPPEGRDMTADPGVTLSGGNYWKSTYTNDEGIETEYLYVVDELRRDGAAGDILPRWYTVTYGAGGELSELKTSQITYEKRPMTDDLVRMATFSETGRPHDEGDTVPMEIQVRLTNHAFHPETDTVYFYAARVFDGVVQAYEQIGADTKTVPAEGTALLGAAWNLITEQVEAGVYSIKASLSSNPQADGLTAQVAVNALPVADAGIDFTVPVKTAFYFDGSRSYDPDGRIALYLWEFGDGASAYGPAPQHTYLASGTYIATLYVIDEYGAENVRDTAGYVNIDGVMRPADSAKVHDVMVTVTETRPDLIIKPSDGLTVTGTPASAGGTVRITAVVVNDKPAPVRDNFIVTLYVDNQYLTYKTVNLSDDARGLYKPDTDSHELRQGDEVTVTFDYTMPDSRSHVVTVKASDMSLRIDEADRYNNGRSALIQGSAGVTAFPELVLTDVKVGGFAPDDSGLVHEIGEDNTLGYGETLRVTAQVRNTGDLAAEGFAVTLFEDGVFVGACDVPGLNPGASADVAVEYAPMTDGKRTLTLTADGPISKIVERNKDDNEARMTLAHLHIAASDLTVTGVTMTGGAPAGVPIVLTAAVENLGEAAAGDKIVVNFYTGSRFIGAATKNGGLAAGASTAVTFQWMSPTATDTIVAVVDPQNLYPLDDAANNSFLLAAEEGALLTGGGPRAALVVTDVATPVGVAYGDSVVSVITVRNDGAGAASAFTVSLFANGALAGEADVASLAAGGRADVPIAWTADKTPTGAYEMAAVADSAYRVVMESRDGVYYTATLAVADGILAELQPVTGAALTADVRNEIKVGVRASNRNAVVGGDASVRVSLLDRDTNAVAAGPFAGVYAPGTATYDAVLDLTGVTVREIGAEGLGGYTLAVTASWTDGASQTQYTAGDRAAVSVLAPLGVTAAVDKTVCETGDAVTVSGQVSGVEGETGVTIRVVGDSVWAFEGRTDANGIFTERISLPARAGGGVAVTAEVRRGAAVKTATVPLYVKGLYLGAGDRQTLTAGFAADTEGHLENIGYTDMDGVTLTAAVRRAGDGGGTLPAVKFRSHGNAYVIGGAEGIDCGRLAARAPGASSADAYASCAFAYRVDAASVPAGDYVLTLTARAASGAPGVPSEYTKIWEISLTVQEAMGDWDVTPTASEGSGFMRTDGGLSWRQTVRPGERVSSALRIVNTGTADLTDVTVTTPEDLPWITAVTAGTDVIKPYKKGTAFSAQGGAATVQVILDVNEAVPMGAYNGSVKLTAETGAGTLEMRIPIAVFVSAGAVGSAVVELRDTDDVPLQGKTVVLYGPVASDSARPAAYRSKTSTEGVGAGGVPAPGGLARFENIPAGAYELSIEENGYKPYGGAFAVQAAVDFAPVVVRLEPQPFAFVMTADREKSLSSVLAKNSEYDDVVWQLLSGESYSGAQPALRANFPADEFDANYNTGRISSRLAVQNPYTPPDGALRDGDYVRGVRVYTESSDENFDPALVTLRAPSGEVSELMLGDLAPQAAADVVWSLNQAALFWYASVEDVSESVWRVTLPGDPAGGDAYADVTWGGRAEALRTAWLAENGQRVNGAYAGADKYAVEAESAKTLLVTARTYTDEDGVTRHYGAPDGRVPKLASLSVDRDGKTVIGPGSYQFSLVFEGYIPLGTDSETGQEITQAVKQRVPVLITYTPEGYYVNTDAAVLVSDLKVNALFEAPNGPHFKYFNEEFLASVSGNATRAGAAGDGFQIGFAQDIVYDDSMSKLSVAFTNPSQLTALEDVTIELIISDLAPDENGELADGAERFNEAFLAEPVIRRAVRVADANGTPVDADGLLIEDGKIVIPRVLGGGSFSADFLLRPTVQAIDPEFIIELVREGELTEDEAYGIFEWIDTLAGEYYAWIRYGYTQSGRAYAGSTAAVKQTAEHSPALYTTYDVYESQEEDGVCYLTAIVTNTGRAAAKDVRLNLPNLPALDGTMTKLLASVWSRADEAYDEDWETRPPPGVMEIGTVAAGESVFAVYKLRALDYRAPDGFSGLRTLANTSAGASYIEGLKQSFNAFGGLMNIDAYGGAPAVEQNPFVQDTLMRSLYARETLAQLLQMLGNTLTEEEKWALFAEYPEQRSFVGLEQNGDFGVDALYDQNIHSLTHQVVEFLQTAEEQGRIEQQIKITDLAYNAAVFVGLNMISSAYKAAKIGYGTYKAVGTGGKLGQALADAGVSVGKDVVAWLQKLWAAPGKLKNGVKGYIKAIKQLKDGKKALNTMKQTARAVEKLTDEMGDLRKLGDLGDLGKLGKEQGWLELDFRLFQEGADGVGNSVKLLEDNVKAVAQLAKEGKDTAAQTAEIGQQMDTVRAWVQRHINDLKILQSFHPNEMAALAQRIDKYKQMLENGLHTQSAVSRVTAYAATARKTKRQMDASEQFIKESKEFESDLPAAVLDLAKNVGNGARAMLDGDTPTAWWAFGKVSAVLKPLSGLVDALEIAFGFKPEATAELRAAESMAGVTGATLTFLSAYEEVLTKMVVDERRSAEEIRGRLPAELFDLVSDAVGGIAPDDYETGFDVETWVAQTLDRKGELADNKFWGGGPPQNANRVILYRDEWFEGMMQLGLKAFFYAAPYTKTEYKFVYRVDENGEIAPETETVTTTTSYYEAWTAAFEELDKMVEQLETNGGSRLFPFANFPVESLTYNLARLNRQISNMASLGNHWGGYQNIQYYQASADNFSTAPFTTAEIDLRAYRKAAMYVEQALTNYDALTGEYSTFRNINYVMRALSIGMEAAGPALGPYGTVLGGVASVAWDLLNGLWTDSLRQSAQIRADNVGYRMGASVAELQKLAGAEIDMTHATSQLVHKAFDPTLIDPPLPVDLLTFSVADIAVPDGESAAQGRVLVTFGNNHTGLVEVAPTVLVYNKHGFVTAVELSPVGIAPGGAVTQESDFTLPRGTLTDVSGYTAALYWQTSESATNTYAPADGPYMTHFYAGGVQQNAALRREVRAGTIASAPVGQTDGALETTYAAAPGRELRFLLKAPQGVAAAFTVTAPGGETMPAQSFDMPGDCVVVPDTGAGGVYTLRAAVPAGFGGRVSVEAVECPLTGPVPEVGMAGRLAIGATERLQPDGAYVVETTTGVADIFVAESGAGAGNDLGAVSFAFESGEPALRGAFLRDNPDALTDDAAAPFIDAALDALPGGYASSLYLFVSLDDAAASAEHTVIDARGQKRLADGVYEAAVRVTFRQAGAALNPYLKSLLGALDGNGAWTLHPDGSATYTRTVQIEVGRRLPSVPTIDSVDDGDGTGAGMVSGTADPNTLLCVEMTNPETGIRTLVGYGQADAAGQYMLTFLRAAAGGALTVLSVSDTHSSRRSEARLVAPPATVAAANADIQTALAAIEGAALPAVAQAQANSAAAASAAAQAAVDGLSLPAGVT